MDEKITFENAEISEYKYSDLHLDLNFQSPPKGSGGLYKKSNTSDIKIDLDEYAIINSIRNLFYTRKGQMLLYPEYGINLERYLFSPISHFTARAIAREILNGVEKYEPRVQVSKVNVDVDIDNQMYTVDIVISIPSLRNKKITLSGILDNNGIR